MRRLLLLGVLACTLALVPAAGAIIGGQADGDAHPYVAFAGYRGDPSTPADDSACSAVLISPTVAVTAAHCFPPGSTVLVFPYANGPRGGPPVPGTFTPHPDFCKPPACTGNPNDPAFFNTEDVGVIRLAAPVVLPRYAELPKLEKSQGRGAVQKHIGKPAVLVGFGVQGFGPQGPYSDFSRTAATEELSRPLPVIEERFVQIDQEQAGFCLGDSGGPVLEKGKDTVLALSSFVQEESTCLGPSFSYRLDSASALGFIRSFL